MSVVHDNLRREARTEHADPEDESVVAPPSDLEPDAPTFESELDHKKHLLVEGIMHLQDTVNTLTDQLDEAQQENQRLRNLVESPVRSVPLSSGPPRSLISQAME